MCPERRGNLFSDEIYRLVKAKDATTTTASNNNNTNGRRQQQQQQLQQQSQLLPSNNKFSKNDVILLSLQPLGSGDYFDPNNLPISTSAIKIEARVVNRGPTYIDIAIQNGLFDGTFGTTTSTTTTNGNNSSNNNNSNNKNTNIRLRADRFFSNIPYLRMVDAITRISAIPERITESITLSSFSSSDDGISVKGNKKNKNGSSTTSGSSSGKSGSAVNAATLPRHGNIKMDDLLREVIISSYAFTPPPSTTTTTDTTTTVNPPIESPSSVADYFISLEKQLSKPPMSSSQFLANQVLDYIQQQQQQQQSNNENTKNPFQAKPLNGPQRTAIYAALTRKLTLIQGPPGTGKTTTASLIGLGFSHQCRSISSNTGKARATKVLACAFSNTGADNLADGFLQLGLKIVRIGKASALSENLWQYSVDAAIHRDKDAREALTAAAAATAQLLQIRNDNVKSKKKKNSSSSSATMLLTERVARDIATIAVKHSIKMSNIAATKAFRDADIIVATCTGAADPRLMAACGLNDKVDDDETNNDNNGGGKYKTKITVNGNSSNSKSKNINNNKGRSSSTPHTAATTIKKPSSLELRTVAPDGLPPLSLPFVIVDEACQSVEPGTLIPLTASNSCRSLVLLGDPCQLPATVKSHQPGSTSSFTISLMERLAATLPAPSKMKMKKEYKNNTPGQLRINTDYVNSLPMKQARSILKRSHHSSSYQQNQNDRTGNNGKVVSYRKRYAGCLLLSIQYRMHPSIAAFSSAMFYDDLLESPVFMANRRSFPSILNEIMPLCDKNDNNSSLPSSIGVRMINVGGRCNEMRGEQDLLLSSSSSLSSTTYINKAEAVRVVSLIKEILEFDHKYNLHDKMKKQIGVISPYNVS